MPNRSRDARTAVGKLLRHLATASDLEWPKPDADGPVVLFTAGGVSVGLSGKEAELYQQCVARLAPPTRDKPGRMSEGRAARILNAALVTIYQQDPRPLNDRIRAALETLDRELQHAHVRGIRVVLPVEGVQLQKSTVHVGAFTFLTTKALRVQRWLAAKARIDVDRMYAPASVWASTVVDAVDESAAANQARYQLQLVLDMINFYAGRLRAPEGAAAYQPGARAQRRCIWFAFPPAQHDVRWNGSTAGPFPVPLRAMRTFTGYARLVRLITADTRTKAEERMLAALRWIGRGAASTWPQQALVDFVIALEALLLGPVSRSGLSVRLQLRGALLLARKGAVHAVRAQLGEVYRLRSQIVHQGSFEVSARDVALARTLATYALLHLIGRREFAALDDEHGIDTWLERRIDRC